jgi:hypothetical protein
VLCASLLTLVLASSASAKVVNPYVYNGTYPNGSFNGSDSNGGSGTFFGELEQVDINQTAGDVYVGQSNSEVYKFNAAGVSQPFTALSPHTVITEIPSGVNSLGEVMVDNCTSGAECATTKGRIFAWAEYASISGYKPSGEAIGSPYPIPSPGDDCGGEVAPNGNLWITTYGSGMQEFNPSGQPISTDGEGGTVSSNGTCAFAMDSQENFYTVQYGSGQVRKYNHEGKLDESLNEGVLDNEGNEGAITVDRSNNNVFVDHTDHVSVYDSSGAQIAKFGFAEPPKSYPGLQDSQGIAVNQTTGEVYVTNNRFGEGNFKVDTFVHAGNITIPDVTTEGASVTTTTATVHGKVDRDVAHGGGNITSCHFEWGETEEYGNSVPCDQAVPITSTEPTAVTATITGLTQGRTYHYRVTANNANEYQSNGLDRSFQPAGPPTISEEAVSNVNTDGAKISAKINPNGGITTYKIEYGEEEGVYPFSLPEPEGTLGKNEGVQKISVGLSGLTPATRYHYRVVATNANNTTNGPDREFMTFPTNPTGPDECSNAQVRQQTGASLLLDCRAYELTSAGNTGGYDVQSDLIPGQQVFAPQPGASDRVLYSIHFGTIPATGDPTNLGPDPYVATRGANGWNTTYVGIPANGTPASEPFGSPLASASGTLGTFAFGGPNICSPCFAGELGPGIPVRLPNGSLVQGMKGDEPVAEPTPAGTVLKPLSADGTHLVFGSTTPFEPDGNSGEVSIYDRNLGTGKTHVVSKTTSGETMKEEGEEIGELDISADGSRILFGKLVSTDSAGNKYWHLYMNVGDASKSIDLTPSTTSGVLYDGMTTDGTKVFFTTPDALTTATNQDTDSSADIYRADVGSSSSTLARVSTGSGAGNSNACSPVAGKEGPHWNNVSGTANCDAVAFAGGAGVASGNGTIYFLSPEKLDGNGTQDEANLFVASPGGSPHFVATLEAISPAVRNAVYDNEVHRYTDFQVTPNGDDAAFASKLPLTEFNSLEHSEVFRYDSPSDELACVSCAITGAAATGDATLSAGLNLANNGSVFFTSAEALVLRDTNGRKDAYEWEEVEGEGAQQLISTGTNNFDSGLLSVSANGVNAYFFTRATLVPQDHNGSLMKIYDAREDGGFLVLPNPGACVASDECHGAGTQPAPPPPIGTFEGTGGNVPREKKPCKKGFVRKHGKCVKKHHKKKKHHKRHTTRRHG